MPADPFELVTLPRWKFECLARGQLDAILAAPAGLVINDDAAAERADVTEQFQAFCDRTARFIEAYADLRDELHLERTLRADAEEKLRAALEAAEGPLPTPPGVIPDDGELTIHEATEPKKREQLAASEQGEGTDALHDEGLAAAADLSQEIEQQRIMPAGTDPLDFPELACPPVPKIRDPAAIEI